MYDKLYELYSKNGVYFNMAVSYLLDVGYTNIEKVNAEAIYQEAVKKENKSDGIPVMTAGFQKQLVILAKEIAAASSPVKLIQFAQKVRLYDIGEPDWKDVARRAVEMAREIDSDTENEIFEEQVKEYLDFSDEEYDMLWRNF